jgi:hypothetical protein
MIASEQPMRRYIHSNVTLRITFRNVFIRCSGLIVAHSRPIVVPSHKTIWPGFLVVHV